MSDRLLQGAGGQGEEQSAWWVEVESKNESACSTLNCSPESMIFSEPEICGASVKAKVEEVDLESIVYGYAIDDEAIGQFNLSRFTYGPMRGVSMHGHEPFSIPPESDCVPIDLDTVRDLFRKDFEDAGIVEDWGVFFAEAEKFRHGKPHSLSAEEEEIATVYNGRMERAEEHNQRCEQSWNYK